MAIREALLQQLVDGINALSSGNSALFDAFGRSRVSNQVTLFDSKLLFGKSPLVWDELATGAGATSTHTAARASVSLAVSASTAGKIVRQTFESMNYQPGKSQLIQMTSVVGAGQPGIIRRLGYFDDSNGIFFEQDEGVEAWVIRSAVSGAGENRVKRPQWDDPMDGTGASGVSLDFSKAQIFHIDFEWLAVGGVRVGFIVDNVLHYAHTFLHANNITSTYMSTPNLPLRYEIENEGGVGAAAELECICSTVASEGGSQPIGLPWTASNAGSLVNANNTASVYACVGIQLKTAAVGCRVDVKGISLLGATSNDAFQWLLYQNPTVAGTFVYGSLDANSCVEFASGAAGGAGPTVSGGTIVRSGYVRAQSDVSIPLPDIPTRLGFDLSSNPTTLVLCVRPLSSNLDVYGAINFDEIQ